MDLATVLETNSLLSRSDVRRLFLICGHSAAQLTPILINLSRGCLLSSNTAKWFANSTTDPSQVGCLFVCLQHPSSQFYQRALNLPANTGQITYVDPFATMRDTKLVEQSGINTTVDQACYEPLGDALTEYLFENIHDQVQKFVKIDKQSLVVIIDDLTVLLDLGLCARRIDRLLQELYTCSLQKDSQLLLVVGSHLGDSFDANQEAPDMEPAYVHCMDLWRSRANLIFDLRPLVTGYSPSLDGELTIRQMRRPDSHLSPIFNPINRQFHYACSDRRKVLCYIPGRSELVS